MVLSWKDIIRLADRNVDLNCVLRREEKDVQELLEMEVPFYCVGLERFRGWDEWAYDEMEVIPLTNSRVPIIVASRPDKTDHLLKRDAYAVGIFRIGDVKIIVKREYYNGSEPEKSYHITYEVPPERFEKRKIKEICKYYDECRIKLLRRPLKF